MGKGTYNVVGSFAKLGKRGGDKCGCGCGDHDNCHADPAQSDAVIYSGPNLSCTGIRTCDNLTLSLEKIDNVICQLIEELYNLTSTTTTTRVINCALDGTIDCSPCGLDGAIICPECMMIATIQC